jgi:hypothetical protein
MGQNAAFEKGFEFGFDEFGQARPGLGLDLGEEGLDMFLYQLIEDGFFRPPPLIVCAVARLCGGRCRLNRLLHRP